jgi:signal transduction histidine kinase
VPIVRVLREERDVILAEWEAEVRRVCSHAATLAPDELRDDIPHFLDRLAVWLATDSTDTRGAVARETTGRHALHRLQHGVELRDLIHEFRLLRQVVLRHVMQDERARDGVRNLARFADAVDHAMTESVETYAKARDEARETMLAVLSHDLKSPLAAIRMSSSALLKSGRLYPAEASAVSRIARSTDRITRMISALLDLARSRFGGKMPVDVEWIDLGDVVQSAVEELQLVHPERDVALACEGDVRGCWDHDRMAQLASNLVANAIRHGRDPVRITVRDQGALVELCVTNRGGAIPKDAIPTLFEPYRRGAQANRAGLGLGLFIVAEIVRAHGGTVGVESDDEQTTFVARLPKQHADPHACIGAT